MSIAAFFDDGDIEEGVIESLIRFVR